MNGDSNIMERWRRFQDSDFYYSFKRSKITVLAAILVVLIMVTTLFAPWIAPHDPFNVATLDLMKAELPPAWMKEGESRFLLGTDNQGRDVLSAILYGSRISLLVGFCSVMLAMGIGRVAQPNIQISDFQAFAFLKWAPPGCVVSLAFTPILAHIV
ncbi:MAG: hypothetical protein H5T33_07730, partial [Candidatus Methanosuratus sp.]|nr:hypothetical protein [Candidatus Methanosuratincola sp.]